MEPEFIVDEEPVPVVQLREGIIAAAKREYELRQSLRDKNLSRELELFREAKFLRDLIASKERQCDELVQAWRLRIGDGDGADPNSRRETVRWLERVERIQKAFDNVLEGYGVMRYMPSGKALPERDETLDTVSNTGQEPGTIVEVIKPAYLWRGEVLRSAKVFTAE